jgi:hypothetical protein
MAAWLSGHDGVFGGELAHIEHGQEQFRFRQDSLRLTNHVRGRKLAAGMVIVEQCLDLRHALADFPDRIIRHPFLRVVMPHRMHHFQGYRDLDQLNPANRGLINDTP